MERLKRLLKELWTIIRKPEMTILPGQLAFFLILSIFPIITLIGYLASTFMISLDAVVAFASDIIPTSVIELLIPYINGRGFDTNIFVFIVIGFFFASNGPNSIVVASNMLYGNLKSNTITDRVKAIIMTILLIIVFVFIILVLAFGNSILKWILTFDQISAYGDTIYLLFSILKWPFALLFIFYCIKLIYTIAPAKRIPSKYVNKGAIFTTVGWTLATTIYSYYVSHFSKYDLFYGSLSNIIVLMMWVYIIAYILVIGIAINTNHYEMVKIDSDNL